MRKRTGMKRTGAALAVVLVAGALAGCAEMSGTQKGAAIGAGTGAVAGAIIGNQVRGNRPGHAATGAIIGALGGAAVGALAGDQYDKRQAQRSGELQPVPPPPPPYGTPPPPPPSQASVTVPGQYAGDPTQGRIVNATPYRIQVYIDGDPARSPGIAAYTLNPSEALPVNLDIGTHRIVAVASRDTQFGPRSVGRADIQHRVDVRGSGGWEVRLTESQFH
jgi:hypothetical protein